MDDEAPEIQNGCSAFSAFSGVMDRLPIQTFIAAINITTEKK